MANAPKHNLSLCNFKVKLWISSCLELFVLFIQMKYNSFVFCYILNSMDVMDIFVLSNNLDVQYSLNILCIFLKFIYHRLVIK